MCVFLYIPMYVPSASIIITELNLQQPLSSKKLIGSTTSSSFASSENRLSTGFPSTGLAMERLS